MLILLYDCLMHPLYPSESNYIILHRVYRIGTKQSTNRIKVYIICHRFLSLVGHPMPTKDNINKITCKFYLFSDQLN